ncbi:UDP-3-O-[3-hydroxymyristoyl] N-acetylglucosamine deacetylase [Rubellimicrobium thermophilum DSM 16684]|uniref:UDP-3-O-acyl-N-acetylglucosamine deacetylase n=1 Tax=Rubellimicrobium thermophilum DSM 16684 TaxID=1123069 RepID=S9R5H9_9RHOB|nr:UDP-3-O-acyl-N-acetylglucosamine deacetylase [Rubellimicrobium thermophilum]EPX87152.1 UDP-3-O-[3-hydroxymyristoyl] N-acetylglucosamine deacetylase [Rubellimicrobium thermophilum DSM 16684]
MQTTLNQSVVVAGAGLHTGTAARVVLRAAPADSGILFRRMDAGGASIPARWDRARHGPLATRLLGEGGVEISTVEHLMAAFAGLGIHNATVEVEGPELPILDGSAAPWVKAILQAGIRQLDAPLRAIALRRTVEVTDEQGALARLEPAPGLSMHFVIAFRDEAIGRQELSLDLANGAFLRELCQARTFCRLSDVERMRKEGLALGGSFGNAVVVDGARVLTPGGLRYPDEPVRHKMLDAMGDLALAGAPLLARYTGLKAGHTLTNRLLHALFADDSAWCFVTVDAALAQRLPGAGVTPEDLSAAQVAA